MAESFSINEFKSQYELQNAIQSLCTALGAIRTPNNAQLIPTAAGTPIGNLLHSLNGTAPAALVPYIFELDDNISINDVKALCITNNVQFVNIQKTASGRAFYDTTFADPARARNYIEFSRPKSADTNVERDRILFIEGSTVETNNNCKLAGVEYILLAWRQLTTD
jgi:hypothetical protein